MSDTRAVSANRDARERMIPNRLVNNSQETLSTKEEKAGRKRVTLSEASRRLDGTIGSPRLQELSRKLK